MAAQQWGADLAGWVNRKWQVTHFPDGPTRSELSGLRYRRVISGCGDFGKA